MTTTTDNILKTLRSNPATIGVLDNNLLYVLCQYPADEIDKSVREIVCTRLRGKQTLLPLNKYTNENGVEICEQLRTYTPNSLFVRTIVNKSDTLLFYDGKDLHSIVKAIFLSNDEFFIIITSENFPEITDQFLEISSLEEWSQTIFNLRTKN